MISWDALVFGSKSSGSKLDPLPKAELTVTLSQH